MTASATDIITYIGVPLAVLGVLPILYNTFATLASLSRIRRLLRRSRLTALTRSDVVNRVIEIELPRYAVMPLDRFQDRAEYWSLARHPSAIPGGSWTTFNWRTNTIGLKTQRVEYVDQLRQPQVEVGFAELVCYLLDLGAVPDARGWRLLRSTGLWTPVGCSLMMSPDGREKALSIAPLDDSDGHLSLSVAWSSSWITRDHAHLPPYWVRLPARPQQQQQQQQQCTGSDSGENQAKTAEAKVSVARAGEENSLSEARASSAAEMDSIDKEIRSSSESDISCQIAMTGLVTALVQDHPRSPQPDSLYIEHLRIRSGRSDGVWFASAASAYGTSSQTILWNYKIPDAVLSFSRRETVPCGVLVLLGLVDESETPEWATKHKDAGVALDRFVQRGREQRRAMEVEATMDSARREQAVRDRMRIESEQRIQDLRDKTRLDQQRRDQRFMEALQSPKWDSKSVAHHALRWLQAQGRYGTASHVKEIVGWLLHRMIRDGEFASSICKMLDTWKAWADLGGMKNLDYQALQEGLALFAEASLLIALIKDTSDALEGTLSMDLQECLQMWKTVRLG